MTQIPDSAKRRIEEAADKARGGRACDIFTVAAEFGYRLAKSETPVSQKQGNICDTDEAAVAYWQDDLAKFFPTSKGPANTEKLMFKAGCAYKSSQLLPLLREAKDRIERVCEYPECKKCTDLVARIEAALGEVK